MVKSRAYSWVSCSSVRSTSRPLYSPALLSEFIAILLGKGECGRRILVLALVEVPANKPFGLAIAGVELAVGVPANPLTGGELFRGCDEEEQQGVEFIDVLTDADSDPS